LTAARFYRDVRTQFTQAQFMLWRVDVE